MTNKTFLFTLFSVTILLALLAAGVSASALLDVVPALVEAVLAPGESLQVDKNVTTPAIPPRVDICLLEDETGSFYDDIGNLQSAAPGLYAAVVAVSPDAQFAVAGFRDYPVGGYGGSSDWVYQLLSPMGPTEAAWLAGVGLLSADGGADGPEAQYDAIVAAAGPGEFVDPTVGKQGNCGWRDEAGVQRVLVVATDAPFHGPDGTHVNGFASTTAALQAQRIVLVGLKAPGAGGELDALASATGGNVQDLSSDGSNIANAILAALEEITTDVWWEAACDPGLEVTLDPEVHLGIPGETPLTFSESITATDAPGVHSCTVTFIANHYPEEGAPIGEQMITLNRPPDCSAAGPSEETLWPPNHRFASIDVLGVFDLDGDPVTITIDSIYQDEPVDEVGDGEFDPDGLGVGTSSAEVRRERSGSRRTPGNGRVYHIGFTADDGNGNTCSSTVYVGVPHDVKDTPVDDGALYDSTVLP